MRFGRMKCLKIDFISSLRLEISEVISRFFVITGIKRMFHQCAIWIYGCGFNEVSHI